MPEKNRGTWRVRARPTLLYLALVCAAGVLGSWTLLPNQHLTPLLNANTSDWYTYLSNISISVKELDGKPVLTAQVVSDQNFSGFGVLTEASVPGDAFLRIQLRSSKRIPVQIDITENDGVTLEGALFSANEILPSREWITLEIPLAKFAWNSYAGKPGELGQRLDSSRIGSVSFTFQPGVDATLEFASFELVEASARNIFVGLFLAGGVLCLGASLILTTGEQRRAEKALSDTESRYKAIFTAVSDGILVLDRDSGRVLTANPAARLLLKEASPSLDWKTEPLRGLLEQIRERPDQDIGWTGGSGEDVIHLDVSVRSKQISSQEVLLVVLDDVTEAHRANQKRIQLERQLLKAQKMEAVGILAGGVAHDFNNILTGIRCSAELTLDHVPAEWELRDILSNILELSDRGAGLTKQLLAFSRQQPLQPRILHFQDLIRKTLQLLNRVIGADIRVEFRSGAVDDRIRGDSGQLEQVIVNMAINARDAMPNGGHLILETSNSVQKQDIGPDLPAGDYLVLTVRDTGEGIDPGNLPHIFEPFFTTKHPGQGTGLGLAMVYGIIRQHRGEITAESVPGEGTCFEVRLPLCPHVAVEESSSDPAEFREPRGKETILLVEDEPSVRSLIKRSLQRLGYPVLVADSPDSALPLFLSHSTEIALLLSDVVMPGQSGPAFYQQLRAFREDLPVLFISGHSPDLTLSRRLPFLRKPFGPRDLGNKVREVLDGHVYDSRNSV